MWQSIQYNLNLLKINLVLYLFESYVQYLERVASIRVVTCYVLKHKSEARCLAFLNCENAYSTVLLIFMKISLSFAFWSWVNISIREKLCLAHIWGFGYSGNEGEACSHILFVCWCKILLMVYWWWPCSESMQHTCWASWFQFVSCSWMSGDIILLNYCEHIVLSF